MPRCLAFALLAGFLAAADPPPLGVCLPGRVVEVHDGDTLTVEVRYLLKVRLVDCWAPELKRPVLRDGEAVIDRKTGRTIMEDNPEGMRSRDHLRSLALGKPCAVAIPIGEDIAKSLTFGRWLGRVIVNGDDLSYMQTRKPPDGGKPYAGKTREDQERIFGAESGGVGQP
ncbi:MAG: hypothetical protein NNA30_11480 [Nitrospira sp.]|nr:hypothetical protein [Nitrospira sp.]